MTWSVINTAYDNNFTTLLMSCYFENLATLNIILAMDKIQSSKGRLYEMLCTEFESCLHMILNSASLMLELYAPPKYKTQSTTLEGIALSHNISELMI